MTTPTKTVTEPKRDQWGRYLLPDPQTGKQQAWTRATTIAGTLADRFGLEKWAQRNTVLGIAARPDLYALAISCVPEDKNQLEKIVNDAQEAAKSRSGANLGTALHKILERIDSGEDLDVPVQWRPDVDAYCNALADNGITMHPEWMERIVILPKTKVAGTLDRLVTVNGTVYVADLKTGKNAVEYGSGDIAIQLALYANASHMWNGDGYDPMPTVDKKRALVMHLPVGEARCDLWWINIEAGREAATQALWTRDWRKRTDLATPFGRITSFDAGDDW